MRHHTPPERSFHEFPSRDAAVAYRRDHGTGGWIFAAESGVATLFPWRMTARQVLAHPITAGCSGTLVGCDEVSA